MKSQFSVCLSIHQAVSLTAICLPVYPSIPLAISSIDSLVFPDFCSKLLNVISYSPGHNLLELYSALLQV